jgi:hypothetical protein
MRAAVVLSFCLAAVVGCGLGDSDTIECRCVETTDLNAFPHCREADVGLSDGDPSSPFSTRVPECPSGDLLFLREPTTPEAVLFNVRDTFEGFSPIQYVDQLSEDFLFVPELNGLELYREVYNPPGGYDPDVSADSLWAREQERRFAINLLDRENFQRITVSRWYDANLDEQILYDDEPGRERYIYPYIIDFTTQPGEGTAEVFEVRGRLEIDLVTPSDENPVWSIRRWRDFRVAAAALTLTELRGQFAE